MLGFFTLFKIPIKKMQNIDHYYINLIKHPCQRGGSRAGKVFNKSFYSLPYTTMTMAAQ